MGMEDALQTIQRYVMTADRFLLWHPSMSAHTHRGPQKISLKGTTVYIRLHCAKDKLDEFVGNLVRACWSSEFWCEFAREFALMQSKRLSKDRTIMFYVLEPVAMVTEEEEIRYITWRNQFSKK